ncbi:MAG TPA: thioredoxin-like domain-containing protein [Chryseosolibacter sp.]|nr:thioredoxin-like domain-containing protein [Chryseosolibacter sp.]
MRIGLLGLILLVSASAFSQTGYNIRFKVDGLKDTTAYLGYYYGESTFVKDTAKVNHKGEFAFDGKQALPQGVYFLVLNKTRIFELVVGQDQNFTLQTSTSDYVKNMQVTDDVDNRLFFENMVFNMERHKEAEPFIKTIQDSTLAEDQKKTARENFMKINEKVLAYQDKIIQEHPGTLTARIFKASKAIKIPDPPKRTDGSIDSTFQLRWYREHFFDYFDLADDALIRMPRPIYQEKINEYLDKLYAPQADTLKRALNLIISKAKKNQETYKYAVWVAVLKFQNPEIMGLDEVFVHLNDKYFASGEMNFWANTQMRKNLSDHADRLRKSLIGQKGANLIMQDINLKPRALYDIRKKYTVLYIFDPDCGSCKKETPKLVDFYTRKKFDVEVYAVSADTSMVKMRNYIKEMNMKWITVNGPRTYVGPYQDLYDASTTPTLYVLDNQKKIIGKKIPAEKLEDFLTQYEKIERLRSSGKL